MAKNYGDIVINMAGEAHTGANYAAKIAYALGQITGNTFTSDVDGSYAFIKSGENSLIRTASSPVSQSMSISIRDGDNSYSKSLSFYTSETLTISYVKSTNYVFFKIYPVYNTSGSSVLQNIILRKNGTSWGISGTLKEEEKLTNYIYTPATGDKISLSSGFNFNSPNGKIYVSDCVEYNNNNDSFIAQTAEIKACSYVELDSQVKFDGKNYYAIDKNHLIERTE